MNNETQIEPTTDELIIEFYQELLDKAMALNRKMIRELTSYRRAYPEHRTQNKKAPEGWEERHK